VANVAFHIGQSGEHKLGTVWAGAEGLHTVTSAGPEVGHFLVGVEGRAVGFGAFAGVYFVE